MTDRDVVFAARRQALYERNRYSPVIRCNGLLFVSGQVGSREDGSPEPHFDIQRFPQPQRCADRCRLYVR